MNYKTNLEVTEENNPADFFWGGGWEGGSLELEIKNNKFEIKNWTK